MKPTELLTGSLRKVNQRYDLGEINSQAYLEIISEAFDFMRGMTYKKFFDVFGDVLVLDTEMIAIKDDLRRKGILTALITNMNPFHAEFIRDKYPEIFKGFDCTLISCEEQVAKPNPEALIRPLNYLGVRPEETVFIDDYDVNIEAYCKLGVKGWLYNVTDPYYCQNGKLEEERNKFRNFLNLLWEKEILKPR